MFLLLTRYHYWLDNITYNYYICIILYVYLHPNIYIYIYNIFYNRNLKNRKTIYKLRWYPQQPRRFIFTNLSEACCEAKRWKPSAEPVEPDPALHQRFPKPSFPQPSPEPVEPDLALHQSLRNLHRNLHRKPVEPDLALHQSLPDLLRNRLGTLLNLTSFCTKASQTFSGTPEPCWTWPLCTKASHTFSGTFGTFGTSLNLTRRLHQSTPEPFWAEDPAVGEKNIYYIYNIYNYTIIKMHTVYIFYIYLVFYQGSGCTKPWWSGTVVWIVVFKILGVHHGNL